MGFFALGIERKARSAEDLCVAGLEAIARPRALQMYLSGSILRENAMKRILSDHQQDILEEFRLKRRNRTLVFLIFKMTLLYKTTVLSDICPLTYLTNGSIKNCHTKVGSFE